MLGPVRTTWTYGLATLMSETISALLVTEAGLILRLTLLKLTNAASPLFSARLNPETPAVKVKGLRVILEMEAFLPVALSILSTASDRTMPGRTRMTKRSRAATAERIQIAGLSPTFMGSLLGNGISAVKPFLLLQYRSHLRK